MIWETNGRYFQRDEKNGTKRISAERYAELSAEKPSEPSEPKLAQSLSVPSFEISEEEREEYARSFRETKEEIRSLLRKRLEARGFEYTNGVPMTRKSKPEPQEIEIDFEEDDEPTTEPQERAQKIVKTPLGEIRVACFGEKREGKREASISLDGKPCGNLAVEYHREGGNLYTTWIGVALPTILIEWGRQEMWKAIAKWTQESAND